MTGSPILLTGALSLWMLFAGPLALAEEDELDSLFRRGIQLHEEGDYEGAINVFEGLLELVPGHPVVMYELANTYFTSGDYGSCAKTAERAMKGELEESLIGPLYAVGGSCLSQKGKSKKALEMFETGLEKSPDDVRLNFNIAVTLMGEKRYEEAIKYLERTVRLEPGYSSPYYLLGQLYRLKGQTIPAMLVQSRFVALEPNGPRCKDASTQIFEQLSSGVEAESEQKINVFLSLGGDEDPYKTHKMGLSLAGALMYTSEEKEKGEAARHADSLVSFWKMMADFGPPGGLESSAAWATGGTPLGESGTEAELETLAYLVALRAQIPGASDWFEANGERLGQLEKRVLPEDGR